MTLVALDGVSKSFGDVQAVDDVTVEVDRGEVVGFLGPNGAGKTTTMRLVTGLLEPDEGSVAVAGLPVGERPVEARSRIGYLPETTPIYRDMLVEEYLEFVAELRGIEGRERRRRIDEAVQQTGIQDVFYRPVDDCSKGYRQRVGIAQAILPEPDVLILDEPTEGLDPNQRVEIRELITSLGRERTVVLSTHVMQEVQRTCERLLIIHEGRIVADGPVDGILGDAAGRISLELDAPADDARSALEDLAGIEGVDAVGSSPRPRFELTVADGGELEPEIFDLARERDWPIWELHREEENLEDVFRQLTGSRDDE